MQRARDSFDNLIREIEEHESATNPGPVPLLSGALPAKEAERVVLDVFKAYAEKNAALPLYDIVVRSGLGEFRTRRALKRMLERGAVFEARKGYFAPL